MSACPQYQETLWLDVYNELTDTIREEWEIHLGICDGCREEKKRMAQTVVALRENMQPPPTAALSPENLIRLSEPEQTSIFSLRWWRKSLFDNRLKLVPALATFGMVLFVAGVLNYRTLRSSVSQTESHTAEISNQIVTADADMLNNLDLLKDLETLQQLIQVVDRTEYMQPNFNHRENTQGKIRHDRQKAVV